MPRLAATLRGRFANRPYMRTALERSLQAVAWRGLDEERLGVVAHFDGEPRPHLVLRRPAGALQVTRLQGDLRYVRAVEGMADPTENLARCCLEVHSVR